MQQVIVEVLHAALLKLLLEDALLVAVLLDEGAGQLVGQHVGVAVVALHESLAHGSLAGALVVEIQVVEVSETGGEILVHHLAHERYINRSGVCRVGQRQTHAAKAELLHVSHTGPLPCIQITTPAIVARQKAHVPGNTNEFSRSLDAYVKWCGSEKVKKVLRWKAIRRYKGNSAILHSTTSE